MARHPYHESLYIISQESDIYEVDSNVKRLYINCFVDNKVLESKFKLWNTLELLCIDRDLYLKQLPQHLKVFLCVNCNIYTLPEFPSTLEILDCSSNNISSLSRIPPRLSNLTCYNNKLTRLPIFHRELQDVDFSGNNLILEREYNECETIEEMISFQELEIKKEQERFEIFVKSSVSKNLCLEILDLIYKYCIANI